MARAWRITKAKYAPTTFDGEGARLYGGRWSSPGTRVVYIAESLSLATLEVLVHLQQPSVLSDYVVFTLDFPDDCIEVLAPGDWPPRWRDYPAPPENQVIGDRWVRDRRSLILRVPSAVTRHEANFLVNPLHPDFRRATIQGPSPLDVDARVFQR
jgi:RES domain-containing protein